MLYVQDPRMTKHDENESRLEKNEQMCLVLLLLCGAKWFPCHTFMAKIEEGSTQFMLLVALEEANI